MLMILQTPEVLQTVRHELATWITEFENIYYQQKAYKARVY